MLRAWLFRERAVRGPGAIELDVVDRQVTRELTALTAEAAAAAVIEHNLDRFREKFRGALTDQKSPGVIDAAESRALARALNGTAVAAHRHTGRLEKLT